jgi:hypothetical protein
MTSAEQRVLSVAPVGGTYQTVSPDGREDGRIADSPGRRTSGCHRDRSRAATPDREERP